MQEISSHSLCPSGRPHHYLFESPRPGRPMVRGRCKRRDCGAQVEAPVFLDMEHNPRSPNYATLKRVGLSVPDNANRV